MKNKISVCILRRNEQLDKTKNPLRFIAAILFLICVFSLSATAQDMLILKSGKELKVNIVEEGTDIIKYREFENPTGPLFSIGKDKVAEIRYRKGPKGQDPKEQVIENTAKADSGIQKGDPSKLTVKKRFIYLNGVQQSTRSVKTMMEDTPEALNAYESGRTMCNLGNSCAIGIILTSFISSSVANKQPDENKAQTIRYVGLAIDGGFLITAIILGSKGRHNIQKSVQLYNSATGKPVTYNFDLGLQENGIGIALKF